MSQFKLILMGNGKVVLVPPESLTPSTAKMIQEEFARFSRDPGSILTIMGEPVEVIDNRPKEPATETEVILQEATVT